MLLEKVDLLNIQVKNLEEINSLYIKQDSVRCKEIDKYKNAYEDEFKRYNKLNKKYKTTCIISLSSLLFLLGALIW